MALEALEFHIEGMLEDGDEIPDPEAVAHVLSEDVYLVGMVDVALPEQPKRWRNIVTPRAPLSSPKLHGGNCRGCIVSSQLCGMQRLQYGLGVLGNNTKQGAGGSIGITRPGFPLFHIAGRKTE